MSQQTINIQKTMSNKIINFWESVGMLKSIAVDERQKMAYALENQRLFNNFMTREERYYAAFFKYSIPTIFRLVLENINTISYITSDYCEPYITDIKFSIFDSDEDLAEECIDLTKQIKKYIDENLKDLKFCSIGLFQNNKISIYGDRRYEYK